LKPYIGITLGDPAGIGPEIAVKALSRSDIYNCCIPVIIGDKEPLTDANRFTRLNLMLKEVAAPEEAEGNYGTIDYINLSTLAPGSYVHGKVDACCGKAAFTYITKGIDMAMHNKIQAVVTGPINKEAINLAGHHFSGHTEIFSHFTKVDDYAMMLISENLRVIHVTTHVSMRDACGLITKERVYRTIRLAEQAMKALRVENYRIGVAGFNAHSSENGLFGEEEAKAIIPAIEQAQKEGIDVEGPVPPDTVFVKAVGGMYDVVVAMYHDQGHIPLKLSGFRMDKETGRFTSVSGINTTIGLPIIRTSVDHGTAFDKAGKNLANEESMVDAIKLAAKMARNRC